MVLNFKRTWCSLYTVEPFGIKSVRERTLINTMSYIHDTQPYVDLEIGNLKSEVKG